MPNDNRIPWWLWPNVLNLDAPLITAVWQEMFAHTAGVRVTVAERLALFLAVWMIYAADRLLDGMRLGVRESSAARHRFAHRHGSLLLAILVAVVAAEAWIVVFLLPWKQLAGGAALGLFVGVYFAWNQLAGAGLGRSWLKELVVSVVFAVGAALVPLLENPVPELLGAVAGFAVVCMANCLFIARVERERDRDRGELSIAANFHPARRPARWLALATIPGVFAWMAAAGPQPAQIALLGSAVMLALAPWIESRAGGEAGCVWVDAALMTPAIVLPFL